jgi:hypothetical protein
VPAVVSLLVMSPLLLAEIDHVATRERETLPIEAGPRLLRVRQLSALDDAGGAGIGQPLRELPE